METDLAPKFKSDRCFNGKGETESSPNTQAEVVSVRRSVLEGCRRAAEVSQQEMMSRQK